MRNLKRALSLALASIMVLGLMVVGASAASFNDLTDKDEIKNKEAVNTMVSLGVISGKDNGAYDPTGSLTRAEACTLIARMLGGGKDPILGSNIKSNFKDTQGHWAENYIAYCSNLGIIVGVGDGSFNPDGTLTGSAAAKMVLCALGYKPEFEGIGGSNWELATNTLATKVKLYEGLDALNPSATISRDDVAQLIYNGVQANEVEYRNLQGDYSGTLYATEKGTMLANRFGVVEVEGVVTANEYATIGTIGASLVEGKTQLSRISNSDAHTFDTVNNGVNIFNVATGADLLGRTISLYVKVDTTATGNSTKATVIGEPIVSTKNVVATTNEGYGTSKNLTNFATKNNLTAASNPVYSYNYGTANGVSATYAGAGRGIVTTLVDNNADGMYEYAFVVEHKFGEVTSKVTTGDGTVAISGGPVANTYASKDIVGFEDVARGDFVNYIEVGGKLYVTKAETVTGKMTQFDDKNKNYITVDGEKYGTSQVTANMGVIDPATTASAYSTTSYLNKDGVFYLDTCGNIVAVGDVKAASQFAFIIDSQTVTGDNLDNTAKAKAALSADGTTVTKTIYAVDGKNGGTTNGVIESVEKNQAANKSTLYTYTVNGEDQFTFYPVTLAGGAEKNNIAVKFTKGETTVNVDGTKYFADNDTAYFFVAPKGSYTVNGSSIGALSPATIDSVSAYTGYTNAPSFDSALMTVSAYGGKTDCLLVLGTGTESNIVKAIVVVTESAGLSSNLMYLYKYVGDNEYGQVFDVIKDGEIMKNVTITSGATKNSAGMVAKYAESKNGYSVVALGSGSVVSGNIDVKGDNSIVVGGQEYKLTSNSIIANIDGNDTTVTDVALVKGDYVTVAYDTDKSIKAVYVTVPYAANNAAINNTTGNTGWGTIGAGNTVTYTGTAATDVDELLGGIVTSYGSTVTVYNARVAKASAAVGDLIIGDYAYQSSAKISGSTTLSHGTTYYVVVTSQDSSSHAVYSVTMYATDVVSAANNNQTANNTAAAALLATPGTSGTSFIFGGTAVGTLTNTVKLVKDVNSAADVGTALGSAYDDTKVTVTVAKVAEANKPVDAVNLTGTFVEASSVAMNGGKTAVTVTAASVSDNSHWTAYTITVTPKDVPNATVEAAAAVTYTVVVYGA